MWTDDLLNILEEYLLSNTHHLLIAFINQSTASLQLLHSISKISNNITQGLCYFIRKNDSITQITSIQEFLQYIRFGYIHGNSISCLTAVTSTLFAPLFMDNMTIHDSISFDFDTFRLSFPSL